MDKYNQRTVSLLGHNNVIAFDLDSLANAIIDVFKETNNEIYAIYDYNLMLKSLMKSEGLDIYDATDVVNDLLSYTGPIVLFN